MTSNDDKRNLKRLIDDGNLREIRKLDPRIYTTYNPIFHTVDVRHQANSDSIFAILKYFVEECKLTCDAALSRALACEDFEVAEYLHSHGFPLLGTDHIYSLQAMRWAAEHGGRFTKESFTSIVYCWNGKDVDERIDLLFELNPALKEECEEDYEKYLADKKEDERIAALRECSNCGERCETDYTCKCCQGPLCETCGVPADCIHKAEWLTRISNICYKCKGIICGDCMTICYECANLGERCDSSYICEKCLSQPLKEVECKYHRWYYCGKYDTVECAECNANRNYSLRMQ
jgi:hypothetical protein